MVDAPGDVIVVSSECREVDKGTLDQIRMWGVNPRSESKVYCKPFRSIIFGEGVFAFDLFPPGLRCKLDSVLKPYLLVSLGVRQI